MASRDETSHIRDPRMGRRRLVLEDEDDKDSRLVIRVKPRGERQESVRDVDLAIFSENEGNTGPTKDDPPIYKMS